MVGKIVSLLANNIYRDENFRKDFEQLAALELRPNKEQQVLTTDQIRKLIESAAILSLSNDTNYQKIAFKISVFLLHKFGTKHKNIPFASEVIMTRLGDLPTIHHMIYESQFVDFFSYFKEEDHDYDYSTFLFPEVAAKKILNTVKISDAHSWTFTDFQSKIFRYLKEGNNVSFSAPTSAGKSYVIHNYTIFRIKQESFFTCIYLVPTKALVAEVTKSLHNKLRDLNIPIKEVIIVNSANDVNIEQLREIPKKVLVLTQERLQEMLSEDISLPVDLLVVDEAQKVRDEERGVILEDAVNELASLNQQMQVVFISPFIGNPEKFQNIFDISKKVKSILSSKTPVGRNIFYVNFDGRDYVSVSLFSEEFKKLIELERIPLTGNIPTTQYGTKAWMASQLLGEVGHTLVYCTKPSECKTVAKDISKSRGSFQISKELKETIEFMETNVHPQYDLIDALKAGIGYHYGKMPQFVRQAVQDIFEQKKIEYLCCTSTLLEGVNLPARNIVLYKPKKGMAGPMDKFTIRNLAGRVGRLGKDYYGNIYCVDINSWDEGADAFDDENENIESSVEKTLKLDIDLLLQHLDEFSELEHGKKNVGAVATSLIIKQFKYPNKDFLTSLQEKYPHITDEQKSEIKNKLQQVIGDISELDKDIYLNNRSIDPRLQFKLYKHLNQLSNPPPLPFPDESDRKETFNELLRVFELIHDYLFDRDLKEIGPRLCAFVGTKWINQATYKGILESRINWTQNIHHYELTKKEINEIIDEVDEILEQYLKFGYSRGLRCYNDILNLIIKRKNLNIITCTKLPEHLEAGAYDKCVYLLMNVGMSRNNAISVAKMMKKGKINTLTECLDWLKRNKDAIKKRFPDKVALREFEYLLE